ncbi:unnamed protein product [Scytosiphon promiscuus]
MRDHHFSMLSHRSFERWKERHQQARFTFGGWIEGEDENDEAKSDDVQDEVVRREVEPEGGEGQSERGKGVDSWHVPLEGSREWLCVRWLRRQESAS